MAAAPSGWPNAAVIHSIRHCPTGEGWGVMGYVAMVYHVEIYTINYPRGNDVSINSFSPERL